MWFWYAFFSALSSAVSVILNKRALNKINASLVSWSLFVFSLPLLAYPAFKNGLPKINTMFWIASISSVFIYSLGKNTFVKIN